MDFSFDPPHTQDIATQIKNIEQRIASACAMVGRDPKEVTLLLATKTVEPERIIEAVACGIKAIGENRIQELKAKKEALAEVTCQRHFIGHLQSNKIKELLLCQIDCFQALDRWSLAEKLNVFLAKKNKTLPVFVEVNTSREPSKWGVLPEDTLDFVKRVSHLEHLRIQGLMTIGALSDDESVIRGCFATLRMLQETIREAGIDNVDIRELSMGMSQDLELAVQEGATMVRVGSGVFGGRS